MKKSIISIAILALSLSSCLSDLNTNPEADIRLQSSWAIPLVHTRINLGNLVEKDSLATSDPDGLVHIIYREDSLFSQGVYDYTKVPAQDPVSTTFTVGNPDFKINTNLGTFGGAKMKSITISSGLLFWQTETVATDTIEVFVRLLNTEVGSDTNDFVASLFAVGPGTNSGQIDISGLHFDLTNGTPAYNNIGFEMGLISADTTLTGTDLDVTLEFENLAIEEAVGYFGDRVIEVPSGVFPTNLSILSNISGGLYLANPEIKLFSKSNIGLPLSLNANIIGVNEDSKSVNLGLQPYAFTGSQTIGMYQIDTFAINVGNSNIDNFIANIPSNIIFSGDVTLNPDGEPTNDNFITNDGNLIVGLEVDLPLELKTKNLTIEQTIKDLDFGVDQGDVDYVEQLTIGFRVENAFPLDADLHFYFQDSTGNILDSAFIAIFDAASIDGNGNVTIPATGDRFLDFSGDQIKTILKSNDIRIKVILNTSNGGNEVVRLLTDYYIDFIIGIKAKMNYAL